LCYIVRMIITPEQLRAARAFLRLEQDELARRSSVSVATIRRLETVGGHGRVAPATLEGVRLALEAAGAEFIENGVRRVQAPLQDTTELFRDLQAISIESARRLAGHELLTDSDLYDENGLPA